MDIQTVVLLFIIGLVLWSIVAAVFALADDYEERTRRNAWVALFGSLFRFVIRGGKRLYSKMSAGGKALFYSSSYRNWQYPVSPDTVLRLDPSLHFKEPRVYKSAAPLARAPADYLYSGKDNRRN